MLFMLLYMFFDCKCKSLKILGEHRKTQQKETETTTEKLKEKQKTTDIHDFQPTNLREK